MMTSSLTLLLLAVLQAASGAPLLGSSNLTTLECACSPKISKRVVGGRNAAIREYPWNVGIKARGTSNFFCGGTLITDKHVLTAAHCTQGESSMVVSLGSTKMVSIQGMHVERSVVRITQHPQWTRSTIKNDLAILELESPVTLGETIRPACYTGASPPVETMVFVSGYGFNHEGGNYPGTLQVVGVPVVTNERCHAAYPDYITKTNICAGYEEGQKDACQGDSGGPLAHVRSGKPVELVGTVSFGIGCARPGKPGVYTRVSEYTKWIQDVTRGSPQCSNCGKSC